jgi:hypothetical protein
VQTTPGLFSRGVQHLAFSRYDALPGGMYVKEKLAIVGATVIDVGDFGASDLDLTDSVVVIEDGVVTAVGSRLDVVIPADARVLVAEGRFIVPGLTDGFAALMPTFSLLYLDRPWASNPWKDPVARLLDPADINAPADTATGRHTNDAAHQVAYSALARAEFLLEEAYHRAGARYLAGSATDVWGTMPGISLHSEIESLVRLGLTPREALAAASSNFASVFPNWGRRGEVKAGWMADLLVLTEDPRESVRNLRTIETVILAGRIVDEAVPLENGRDGLVLLDGLFDTRRMYGGSLVRGWVYAAVALHYLDGFEDRLQRGIAVSEDLFSRLDQHSAFTVHRMPHGSNVFVLEVRGTDPGAFRTRLAAAGVSLREPRDGDSFVVQVNETWAAADGEELSRRMVAAL